MITEDRLQALIKQNRSHLDAITLLLRDQVFDDTEECLMNTMFCEKSVQLEYKLEAWEAML